MDAREADRRRGDRRDNDRRAAGRRREDAVADTDTFLPGWMPSAGDHTDSRFLDKQARRLARSQDTGFARVYRAYAAARGVVGLGLVAVQGVSSLMGSRVPEWVALVSVAYAVQAITLWLLPRFGALAQPPTKSRERRRQWISTIGVDLLAFTLLHLLEVNASFNYAALMVLPVLMAGVLTTRLLALGTASAVALVLLFAAWRSHGTLDSPALMLQSGLAGMGLFLITLLAGELAARLAREEVAARGSLELARQQAQLNRLVIEEMVDGVLVVDRRLLVRAANPAARALLVDQGLSPPAPFKLDLRADWSTLLQFAQQALGEGQWPEAGRDVTLSFAGGHTRTLRMRVRFMRRSAGDALADPSLALDGVDNEPTAVLLLEDVRTLQARIRQEKLAAMGRMSAGIAHEIRNPLAAISQANALLMEDPLSPDQHRLTRMVADNVERLKRLVDDVMEVAPGGDTQARDIDVTAAVSRTAVEWATTVELPIGGDSRLRADISHEQLGVRFDPEHLRRVLVNLLDNAHRHASALPGSIVLRLKAKDEYWVSLAVLSDSPVIAPEVERRLFEPFFSTRSRGTGLGLYICRELCERYGASIEYSPRPGADRLRNEFVVNMRRVAVNSPAAALPLGSA